MYVLRLIAFTTVSLIAVSYLAFAPIFAMPLYNLLLFHPVPYPYGLYKRDTVEGVRRQEVFFPTSGGRRLHGWFFEQKAPVKTVLVHHGNGGNLTYRLYVAQHLIKAGCSVFLYDYQGYGRSEGTPSLAGVCADAKAAYKYLTVDRKVPVDNLIVYGESLGTGVTCEILASCPCSGIILNSSFYSLQDVARQQVGFFHIYPSWMFPTPTLDNASVVSKPHPPLLMLHGTDDKLCLVDRAKSLFTLATEPKTLVLLQGIGHNGLSGHPEFDPAVRAFITSLSKAVPPQLTSATKL